VIPPLDPDLALVQAVQQGDEPAFSKLMERHQEAVHRFIYRYVHNESDAEELAQETFVRALLKIGTFHPRARFATWLFQIAVNLCRDHARSRAWRNALRTFSISAPRSSVESNRGATDTDLRSPGASPDENAIQREELEALGSAVQSLPHNLRAALVLTAIEGHSQAEVAEMMGTTAKGVETRVSRARSLLAKQLERRMKKGGSSLFSVGKVS